MKRGNFGVFFSLVLALGFILTMAMPAWAASSLYEFYNSGDDVSRPVQGDTWRGQTFTVDTNHSVTSVKLKMYRQGNPGTVTVSIQPVDKNDHPADVDLTSCSVAGNSLPTTASSWCEIILTQPYTLVGGASYAIVVKAPSGDSSNRVLWRANSAGGYVGGSMEQKVDGNNWVHFAMDCMFEVWGETVSENLTESWVDDDWAGLPNGTAVTLPGGGTAHIGYDAFAVIQDGINAVATGGTVHVAAGVYNPVSKIRINKDNLVLLGPQADVDPRPSISSTRTAGSTGEAVIDGTVRNLGTIIEIDADNVIINGFEVKSGTDDIIYQENAHSGTSVKYCIVHDANGDDGIQLKKCINGILEYNYVYDIAFPGDALSIADSSTNGKIRYNEAHDIGSANAAIYVYDSEDTEIVGNLIYEVTQNIGIRLGNKHGTDAGETGGLIKNNIIHDIAGDGINISTSHVLIEGNDVYRCGSEDGAVFLNYAITDINILSNSVHDNTLSTASKYNPAGVLIENTVDAANVKANFNNIYGNQPFGITNEAPALFDATNNWLGANNGPGGVGSGNGDAVSDNVVYEPWLKLNISAVPSSIAVGGAATSIITADMTRNSADQDTSGQGHIPDGTQIVFTTDKGSIGSTSVTKTTANGRATAYLTSSNTIETATVCAEAPHGAVVPEDQCRVCTTVNFGAGTTQSVATATGTGTVTFTTSAGSITDLIALATTTCGSLAGFSFPHGYFSFNITNITAGATVVITITLPSNMPIGTQYWKCQNGTWINCTSLLGDDDGDNVLILTLTDGGLGDADNQANGTIIDPGGPAVTGVTSQSTITHRASSTLPTRLKPSQMSLQYLSSTPQQTFANQPVTITTNVVNTGDEAGNLNVVLKINGQVEQTRMVSVGPQGTQPVKFTVTKAQPGTYTIDIGGQRGSFIITGSGSGTARAPTSSGLIAILVMAILALATIVVLMMVFRRPA
jgi:hypothetical protein